MTEFDSNDPRLTAFALGELSESERLEVERLLEESPEARAALAEIQETIDLVKDELATEPAPALTVAQRQAIEAQLFGQPPMSGAPAHPVSVAIQRGGADANSRWRWLSLAATAAAMVGIAVMLPRSRQAEDANRELVRSEKREGEAAVVAMNDKSRSAVIDESTGLPEPTVTSDVRKELDALAANSSRELAESKQETRITQLADLNKEMPVAAVKAPAAALGAPAPVAAGASPANGKAQAESESLGKLAAKRSVVTRRASSENRESGDHLSQLGAAAKPHPGPQAANGPQLADSKAKDAKPTTEPSMKGVALVTKSEPAPRPALDDAAPVGRKMALPKVEELQQRGAVTDKPAAAAPESKAGDRFARPTTALAEGDRRLALRDSEKKLGERVDQFSLESESRSPAPNTEGYEALPENDFLVPQESPLSTFSIDVDSASYANMRRFLTQGQLPPPGAIRVEELINYFSYRYPQPKDEQPFSVTADAAPCPWNKEHYIARIGLKAREIDKAKRPATNLVFLVDVSGSMSTPNKLPLVKRGLSLLTEEMTEKDHISIVTYAGDAGLKLEPTPGNNQARIMQVIDGLNAGGSTNGAAGINLAYEQALRHFNKEGSNRVILCTDGDFNVGVSSDDELVKLIQGQANTGVFLSIFGFGMGNLKDSKLEKLADKGNGHYGYIDDVSEARKVFNEELVGTLYTVAKDVKLQVEFNPLTVGAYRLIGYENRTLAAQDFNDDTKDAGEIGAGHTVTALYEIVPVGKWPKPSGVDPLKYAAVEKAADKQKVDAKEAAKKIPADVADDLFTVKLRYKQPDGQTSVKTIDYVVDDIAGKKVVPNAELMWAASVANFGMQLRNSKHAGDWKLEDIQETASGLTSEDPTGRRAEFVELVKKAAELRGRK